MPAVVRVLVMMLPFAACSERAADRDPDCAANECGKVDGSPEDEVDAAASSDPCADPGAFPAWISGGDDCGTEPAIQVHRFGPDTYILRQSLCTSFEAPFLYLLFGEDRVLLEDTGDDAGTAIPIVQTVNAIIEARLAERGQQSIELVVVNSHGHGDHTGYNGEFADLPDTTVVGVGVSDLMSYFGLPQWPEGHAEFDLGGRIVDVVPIPGHQSAHIALYDRRRGLLLTGDSLYPGRLYVNDDVAYTASMAGLVEFTSTRPVCHVLGTHIEMSNEPGDDYPFGTDSHPNEHPLELDRAHLVELSSALDAMNGDLVREVHDDFIIYPL